MFHRNVQAEVASHLAQLAVPAGRLAASRTAMIARSLVRAEHLWRGVVRHDPDARWYTRLHRSDDVEVWLLGWELGQDTRVHDHGGAGGAFVVAEGQLVEHHTSRHRRGGLRRRVHREGHGAAFGASYVHDLVNRGPGTATSIHVYSPPLSSMTFYQITSGRPAMVECVGVAGPEPGLPVAEHVVERGVLAAVAVGAA